MKLNLGFIESVLRFEWRCAGGGYKSDGGCLRLSLCPLFRCRNEASEFYELDGLYFH